MKVKRYIVLVIVLVSVVLTMLLINSKVWQKQRIRDGYNNIPIFQLIDLQGNLFSEQSLSSEKSTMFLFFDPECESCKEEFEQIKNNQDSFSDCELVFVSTLPEEIISEFLQTIDFHAQENMFMLRDTNAELARDMDIKVVPSTLIYDKNRKLVKRFAGQVKAETLIKYLSE